MRIFELQIPNNRMNSPEYKKIMSDIRDNSINSISCSPNMAESPKSMALFLKDFISEIIKIDKLLASYSELVHFDGYSTARGIGLLSKNLENVHQVVRKIASSIGAINEGFKPWHKDYEIVLNKIEGAQSVITTTLKALMLIKRNEKLGKYEKQITALINVLSGFQESFTTIKRWIETIPLMTSETPAMLKK